MLLCAGLHGGEGQELQHWAADKTAVRQAMASVASRLSNGQSSGRQLSPCCFFWRRWLKRRLNTPCGEDLRQKKKKLLREGKEREKHGGEGPGERRTALALQLPNRSSNIDQVEIIYSMLPYYSIYVSSRASLHAITAMAVARQGRSDDLIALAHPRSIPSRTKKLRSAPGR